MISVTVMYEDQRGPVAEFGPHALLKACVFDRLNGQFYELTKGMRSHLAKGNSKLLQKCRKDLDKIAPDGHQVIAVFDNDRVRELLNLDSQAPEDAVIEKMLGNVPAQNLIVILLDENAETLIRNATECDAEISAEELERAVQRKSINARDAVLSRIAWGGKDVRDCIVAQNASFRRLVDSVCETLSD